MDEQEFDQFAEEYSRLHQQSIRITGEEVEFFAAYKVEDMRKLWDSEQSREPEQILDFGGGIGASAGPMHRLFPRAQITIADVSRLSLEIAREKGLERVTTRHFDGATLPFGADRFDMVLAACVFHHIDAAEHIGLMAEIRRVLRPGGYFFVFEHNPANPLTRHAVNSCPFDANAVLISRRQLEQRMKSAGFGKVSTAYRIFFPAFLKGLRPLEPAIGWLPLGAQYRAVGVA